MITQKYQRPISSLSSPIIASVYAMSGKTKGYANWYPYAHSKHLFDVRSGNNGKCTHHPARWCKAQKGWDGPTGLGTPNGVAGF